MKLYLINFQMADYNGKRYNAMVDVIKRFKYWGRLTDTAWCIGSEVNTTAEMRDLLLFACPITSNERVFVTNITDSPWASMNIPNEVADFMKKF